MTVYSVLQLVLAAVVGGIVVERCRTLLYRAPLDTGPWLRAVSGAIGDGDLGAARALVEAGRPAWVAEVARALLSPGGEADVDELLTDYKYEAFRRLRALRILASAATASGFLGAVIEMIWLFQGDHGLMALEAGRVERIALHHAMLSVALGIAIAVFAFVSLAILKRAATTLLTDLQRVATCIGDTPECNSPRHASFGRAPSPH